MVAVSNTVTKLFNPRTSPLIKAVYYQLVSRYVRWGRLSGKAARGPGAKGLFLTAVGPRRPSPNKHYGKQAAK